MHTLTPGGRTPSWSRRNGLIGTLAVTALLIGAVQAMAPASAAAMIREETPEECEAAGGTWLDSGFGPAACIKLGDDSGGGGSGGGGPAAGPPKPPDCFIAVGDMGPPVEVCWGSDTPPPPPAEVKEIDVIPVFEPDQPSEMPRPDLNELQRRKRPTTVIARGPAKKSFATGRNARRSKAAARGRARH